MNGDKLDYVRLSEAQKVARRKRNIAIGLGLAFFCVLAFVVTIIRLHQNINATIS